MKHKNSLIFAFIVLLFVSLACGSSTTEKLQEASISTDIPVVTQSEQLIEIEEETLPVLTVETEIPKPSATTEPPALEPIFVTKFGFGQEDRSASYGFIVENPNSHATFESSQYQIAAYDENDIVVKTDSGYINIMLPGQSLGIGGDLFLEEGVTISKIDVQLKPGKSKSSDPLPFLNTENVSLSEGSYSSYVRGVIMNPYNTNLKDLRVSALLFDDEDNIIGGGYTYQSFILANSSSGVRVSVGGVDNVSRVELFPTLSSLTFLTSSREIPSDAAEIILKSYGFGQKETRVGFGMIIENPNSGFSIESSQYHVTAFSVDGTVLAIDDGYINIMLPEQIYGIGGDLFIDEGSLIDRIQVQILGGKYIESEILPFFSYENASYQPGSYTDKVTGIILNPYSSNISDIRVSAIAYNSVGEIIGGGYSYLDFIPASGKAAVELSVNVKEAPERVELFATVSSLSTFE